MFTVGVIVSVLALVALVWQAIWRNNDGPPLPLGRMIPHLYKWSRDADRFAAEAIRRADAHPRAGAGPIPMACVFKINHEEHHPATSPRPDGQELVIESKMILTRERVEACEFYVLLIRPLRGTDFLPIIRKFERRLGLLEAMHVMGESAGGDMPDNAVSTLDVACVWRITEES